MIGQTLFERTALGLSDRNNDCTQREGPGSDLVLI